MVFYHEFIASQLRSAPARTKLCTHPLRQNIRTFHGSTRALPLKTPRKLPSTPPARDGFGSVGGILG